MSETMELTAINVGYGEALLIRCPAPAFPEGLFTMLIDGGSGESDEFLPSSTGRMPAAEYLVSAGVKHIDVMVSTHTHEDHLCGLVPAAELFPPAELWQALPADHFAHRPFLRVEQAANTSQRKFLSAINDHARLCRGLLQKNCPIRCLCAGHSFSPCPGLNITVLGPSSATAASMARQMAELYRLDGTAEFLPALEEVDRRLNNCSLMLMLEYRGSRILLPGDANAEGYGGLHSSQLKAHLFKVGHHGQLDGANASLLDMVQPTDVLCCASGDRRYNSAHPALMALLRDKGARRWFSDSPAVEGENLPVHHAVSFLIGEKGDICGRYITAL